jgi:hypothetical protein
VLTFSKIIVLAQRSNSSVDVFRPLVSNFSGFGLQSDVAARTDDLHVFGTSIRLLDPRVHETEVSLNGEQLLAANADRSCDQQQIVEQKDVVTTLLLGLLIEWLVYMNNISILKQIS